MTKDQLIKRLEHVAGDEEVSIVLFREGKRGYEFVLLNPTGQWENDPSDVLAFVTTPIKFDTTMDAQAGKISKYNS
jgi:hypothetical protein